MAQHETNLNEIHLGLGKLTAEVKNLQSAVEKSEASASTLAQTAAKSREEMHRRFDGMASEVSQVKDDMAEMKSDLSEAKKVTDDVTKWKQMGMGALAVTGIAAGAISSVITYWWDTILRAVRG